MKTSIEKKLDKAFSLYVRTKNADSEGNVRCVTCGKVAHYKEMDCGHYNSRRHRGTRWLEKNTGVQCTYCNRYNEGDKPRFALYLIGKYGQGILEELDYKSRQITKFSDRDGELMLQEYEKLSPIRY